MRLLRARIRNFRNLGEVEFEAAPRATVLLGQNGQGKTNTLESLYYAATLRPLRSSRLNDLIQFGEQSADIASTYELAGGPREFAVHLEGGERSISVDGKRVSSLEDYFGQVVVVAFTPDDLSLVKGDPEGRRRFLDRAVFERSPSYLRESRDYQRALKARNRILRERGTDALREAFDAQLIRHGARLWFRRLALVMELQPHVARAFDAVGRLESTIELRYRAVSVELDPTFSETQLSEILTEALEAKLGIDRERGFTSVGPHVDDLGLVLRGRAAKAFASQGQQRAIVLALKIGEIENLRSHSGHYPLLLLDDVSSELDPERNEFLMGYLRDLDAQVVLSTTDKQLVSKAVGDDALTYAVDNGTVRVA